MKMKKLSMILAIIFSLTMLLPFSVFAADYPFASITLPDNTPLTDIEVTVNGFTWQNRTSNLYTVTVPSETTTVTLTMGNDFWDYDGFNIEYYSEAGTKLDGGWNRAFMDVSQQVSLDVNNDGTNEVAVFFDDTISTSFAVKFVYASSGQPTAGELNDKVAVSADLAAPTASSASQTITVTVDFTETIDVNAISAENVGVPDGWSVTVQGLGYAGESGTDGAVGVGYDSGLKKIAGGWSSDEDYRHIHGLRLTYTAPANAQGSFTLGCEELTVGNTSGVSVINGVNATKSVTIAAPTPAEGYTVTVSDGSTTDPAEVAIGATVTMTVTVSGGAFNGLEGTVTYDKTLFELTEVTGSAAADDAATDAIELYTLSNTAYADSTTVATLTFTAKAAGTGDFEFSGTVGDYEDFQSHDAVDAAAVSDRVTVKAAPPAPEFTVALGETDYISGINLVLVTGDAAGYTYDGQAMFKVAAYGENVFAYLDSTPDLDETDAAAKVAASDTAAPVIASGYDVNGTGKVDFNDAGAAFGCYNKAYSLADNVAMYLRADVNGDKTADASDVSAIMDNYS
jgi:hypothetical protein